MLAMVKDLMFSWRCGRWKRRRRAWNVTPLALMWVVKTSRAFEDVYMNFIQLRTCEVLLCRED